MMAFEPKKEMQGEPTELSEEELGKVAGGEEVTGRLSSLD